tara:strand:+ start:526 stop:1479 length:954 start_codon:yes stop_codon:yes gene_type:complete
MKVFQEKSGNLIEFKGLSGKKDFDYESEIQKLIENNLTTVFPNLEFLSTEYRIENLRPDSVAFDNDSRSFIIIEYKNVKHKGVIDQGMSYYQLIQEKKENFILLYQKIKGKLLLIDDINWDETKIIFIAPLFSEHQKRANMSSALPIELHEIKKYENNIITLNRLEGGKKSLNGNIKNKSEKKLSITLDEYDIDDFMDGKYGMQTKPTPEFRKLYKKIIDMISELFDDLEFKQRKQYGGFYSIQTGQSICTFDPSYKTKINFYYSTNKKELLPLNDFILDKSGGHYGMGMHGSEIKNEEDIKKAISYVKIVYDEKIS